MKPTSEVTQPSERTIAMGVSCGIRCAKVLTFCAGHRVQMHEGKCKNLHGHNYKVILEAEAASLDEAGRIIDFSILKERIGGYIDKNWDHGFLIHTRDWEASDALVQIPGQKIFYCNFHPTAEGIANYLLAKVCPKHMPSSVVVKKVTVWETDTCYATAEL